MNIFNSLGSNYTFASAMRILFSYGSKNAQQKLTSYLETRYDGRAILTYKGRDAIRIALDALPKGAVVINGYTCVAVYDAIRSSGHDVVYADIPEHGLNFTPATLRQALEANGAIRAVIIQNTLGTSCDIQTIKTLCERHGAVLIEDLAHSIGTHYSTGEEAGTVGDFVILSFSQDKVVDAVSGGALIIRDKKFLALKAPFAKVGMLRQAKDRFYPVITWKIRVAYSLGIGRPMHAMYRKLGLLSVALGSYSKSARTLPGWYATNILSGYRTLAAANEHRKHIAQIYTQRIAKQLLIPTNGTPSIHLRFPILTKNRDGLIRYLRKRNVHVSDIWYDAPIAPEKYLARTDYDGQCPNAERISKLMVNLPTHINVSVGDAETIAGSVNEWLTAKCDQFETRSITDETEWEQYIRTIQPHSFLHTWKWGEQYRASGSRIFRIGVFKNGELAGIALLIRIGARRGSFLLCPHGPILSEGMGTEVLENITAQSEKIAKQEKCDFIRFCPLALSTQDNIAAYRSLGFRDAPIHMHPEIAWMLDVTKTEDDLLREMRKTTRYLVKKMDKAGVEITQSNDPADIEKFWPVYEATVQRQQFTPFNKSYLQKEFELFAKDDQAAFFFGTYKGEIIAAAIIIFYNGSAYYHHSGSIQKFDDINASYLLQWRVIQEAKRRGCTLYNFWGISPADKPKHPWAGLSLFKKGFGGYAEEYVHAQDKPLTPKYALNYVVETARRIRRGL